MRQPYYSDEWVTLYHGDCLEATEWLSADAMLTDPPYGVNWSMHGNFPAETRRIGQRNAGIVNDHSQDAARSALTLWADAPAAMFASPRRGPLRDPVDVLVWHKPSNAGLLGASIGWRRDVELIHLYGDWPKRPVARSSVYANGQRGAAKRPNMGMAAHPHSKPLWLLHDLLAMCPPGVIADPFAGGGSTLVAARNCGRRAIGFEIEERYCEMAAQRLRQGVLVP